MGLKDECGVAGIFGAENAASLSYFALTSLQHRGQESAGIAVSDGKSVRLKKELGLVGDVFAPADFEKLKGSIALSHVRYATAGGRTLENAQPFLNTFKNGSIALAHNGQLVNHACLREKLEDGGSTFASNSDSEVILKLIVRKFIEKGGKPGSGMSLPQDDDLFVQAVIEAMKEIKGSFALCIMTENMLIGARDPNGIRPLCLGTLGGESLPLAPANANASSSATPSAGSIAARNARSISYILASESCAIDAVNGKFLRDIEPGEILVITKEGLRSEKYACEKKKTCIFEYVYFARPDSVIDGIPVQEARYRMGQTLALESKTEADVVIGVPDSGIGAAMGFSKASGIPYVTGIIKNKYIGRTFIAPTQAERENMVFVKLNAIKSDLEGKRVIVIDDSIVRGTTSRRLVEILRRAGAREVHFRVSSPPVKFPCHLGIDTPSKAELISSTHELEEIRAEIGADSLAFISLEGMIQALRSSSSEGKEGWCEGCFSGIYPV
ncbi:amidophosphoribosyltransferase [Treponema sp. UBA3813]|uniref:amidophosphoribosyltransferase n=1 Tax=Treponema sp. UBA3813 TaxID=1947715 RepID=UPI0025DA6543|nr:amidophosphoribosyltransferase [Treponema sp. UBA3813]